MDETIAEARAAVIAVSRQMSRLGLVVSVWGNVSARARGTDLVVVTPSGVDYEALDDGTLCLVDIRTEARVGGRLRPSSETKMHLAVYRARPDVGGIVHTHSVYASAFSVVRQAIPPIVEDVAQVVGGAVECADYAPAGTRELALNAARALGERGAALLANHGVVGVGSSPDEALRVCQLVEKAAQILAVARGLGAPRVLEEQDVAALHLGYRTSYGQRPPLTQAAG